jgi:hypothetical protein
MEIFMKKINFENLEKLANFLETSITDREFSIDVYRCTRRPDNELCPARFISLNDCGTVGCAVGWLPHALSLNEDDLEPVMSKRFSLGARVDYYELANKYLGCNDLDSTIGSYMFSSEWSRSSNQKTRNDTVARIREVIGFKDDINKYDNAKRFKLSKLKHVDEGVFLGILDDLYL